MKLVEEKGIIIRKEYECLSDKEKLTYWQIKRNTFKLISELEDDHLQKAFCYAQTKELQYHNKNFIFYELTQKIEDEATKRGFRLNDIDTDYHRKSRRYKQKIQVVKKH